MAASGIVSITARTGFRLVLCHPSMPLLNVSIIKISRTSTTKAVTLCISRKNFTYFTMFYLVMPSSATVVAFSLTSTTRCSTFHQRTWLRRARRNRREREVHVSHFPMTLTFPSVSGFPRMIRTQSSPGRTTRRHQHAASSLGRLMRFAAETLSLRNMSHTSQRKKSEEYIIGFLRQSDHKSAVLYVSSDGIFHQPEA
jgi:hypothetical protein